MSNPETIEQNHELRRSGTAERAITVASGALMFAPLLRKRTAMSWTAAAAGGALIVDGLSGACLLSHKLGLSAGSPTTQHLKRSITIAKDAADLYALWRNPDTFKRLARPYADVQAEGKNHVRWCIPLPMGQELHGEALMVEERPDEMVHWSTPPDASLQIDEWMRLRPAPRNRGTEMTLQYKIDFSRVPGAPTLRAISSFFRKPARLLLGKVLDDFKDLAETGVESSLRS